MPVSVPLGCIRITVGDGEPPPATRCAVATRGEAGTDITGAGEGSGLAGASTCLSIWLLR